MSECKWKKVKEGYITSCGRTFKHRGRCWCYCPVCGKIIWITRG